MLLADHRICFAVHIEALRNLCDRHPRGLGDRSGLRQHRLLARFRRCCEQNNPRHFTFSRKQRRYKSPFAVPEHANFLSQDLFSPLQKSERRFRVRGKIFRSRGGKIAR